MQNLSLYYSLVPRPLEGRGKAWGLLRAHARKIPFIFRIIRRKISDNDVIVHGNSARKEYADKFVYTVTATIISDSSRRICFHLLLPTIAPGAVKRNLSLPLAMSLSVASSALLTPVFPLRMAAQTPLSLKT